ncbi:MAG: hypothetical protein M3R00_01225 [Pseudomonadota bacterium]|nr:hypothetical protein [Pseudomonadota bacterium]
MQELNKLSPEAEKYVNNIDELTPHIINANTGEFKKLLITPVNHEVFIACLKLALQHNDEDIIAILSRCELTSREEKRKATKLTSQNAKTLLHLVSIQYAERFHNQKKLQQRFLDYIYTIRNKDVIFAAIKWDTFYLKKIITIPELQPQLYYPVIVYAAANNQIDAVRYLHEQNENPHEIPYHRNAMVAAITCNATDVSITSNLDL